MKGRKAGADTFVTSTSSAVVADSCEYLGPNRTRSAQAEVPQHEHDDDDGADKPDDSVHDSTPLPQPRQVRSAFCKCPDHTVTLRQPRRRICALTNIGSARRRRGQRGARFSLSHGEPPRQIGSRANVVFGDALTSGINERKLTPDALRIAVCGSARWRPGRSAMVSRATCTRGSIAKPTFSCGLTY